MKDVNEIEASFGVDILHRAALFIWKGFQARIKAVPSMLIAVSQEIYWMPAWRKFLIIQEEEKMNLQTRKIVLSSMLVAVAVSLSGFSIPVGVTRCFPVQHLCNVIAGVFLGPVYAVAMAFCTSLIRILMGTGSLLAFPGSMVGAFMAGWLYQHTRKLTAAYLGEVSGTGIIGAMLCYPVAALLMGKKVALYAYVIPFMMSTVCGTLIAAMLIGALFKSGVFLYYLSDMPAGEKSSDDV